MKKNIPMLLIILLAFFLRIYRLDELMIFIGDYGWFYLSARDMLVSGNIPLVGITASHTWLHQGPLWTYMLALSLVPFSFHPVSGAYLAALLGTITVWLVYKVGTTFFSMRVGLISALLYATSPLVIIHARTPYHISPIPLATLLFFLFLYKWVKGKAYFLPLTTFMLGILYNFELATLMLWIVFLVIIFYLAVKERKWIKKKVRPQILFLSLFSFLIPMIPMVLYDIQQYTGFYQTTALLRLIKIYLFSFLNTFSLSGFEEVFQALFIYNQRLLFVSNGVLALFITTVSVSTVAFLLFKSYRSKSTYPLSYLLLSLWVSVPLLGIFASKTPSEAYIPILFPAIIFSVSVFLDSLFCVRTPRSTAFGMKPQKNFPIGYFEALLGSSSFKAKPIMSLSIVLFLVVVNVYMLLTRNYLMGSAYGETIKERITTAKEIIKQARGKEYNLMIREEGSRHASFTMNYEYLTWWLGHGPVKKDVELKFVIIEEPGRVRAEMLSSKK